MNALSRTARSAVLAGLAAVVGLVPGTARPAEAPPAARPSPEVERQPARPRDEPATRPAGAEGDLERGALLYRIHCMNCHGETARGDGPTAEVLTVRPPDLTRLARRNGGEFPADSVLRAIDGREEVPGHGKREMPIWGLGLQQLDRDTNQEAEVRDRIRHLVRYLESLQRR